MGRHLLFWFVLVLVGIANGVLREYTYGPFTGDQAAHQISTVTAMFFAWLVYRPMWDRWPLFDEMNAWTVGICWLVLTVAFEFGFGHWVVGHPWESLLRDYDVAAGRIWPVFLLWITCLPRIMLWRDSR